MKCLSLAETQIQTRHERLHKPTGKDIPMITFRKAFLRRKISPVLLKMWEEKNCKLRDVLVEDYVSESTTYYLLGALILVANITLNKANLIIHIIASLASILFTIAGFRMGKTTRAFLHDCELLSQLIKESAFKSNAELLRDSMERLVENAGVILTAQHRIAQSYGTNDYNDDDIRLECEHYERANRQLREHFDIYKRFGLVDEEKGYVPIFTEARSRITSKKSFHYHLQIRPDPKE
jgi:hypothetical protein